MRYSLRVIGGSSNGRTADFESVNLGSIPSPPASNMKKYLQLAALALIVAFVLEVVLILVFGHPHSTHWLEQFAWSGEAVTGVAALIALIGFLYQVNRDKNLSAAELISFFREKVIFEKNLYDEKVRAAGGTSYKFEEHWIELEKFKLWWLRTYHREQADKQIEVHKKDTKLNNELLRFFNLLEEFSLRVKYMDLIDHPALASVRAAYISSIEENSNWILTFVLLTPTGYPGIQELYEHWKKYGERKPEEERLKLAMPGVQREVRAEKDRLEKLRQVNEPRE